MKGYESESVEQRADWNWVEQKEMKAERKHINMYEFATLNKSIFIYGLYEILKIKAPVITLQSK